MPKLDRLSALLEGLTPRLSITHAGRFTDVRDFGGRANRALCIHLLADGAMVFRDAAGECALTAPTVVGVRASHPHRLLPGSAAGTLLCAEVCFEGPASAVFLGSFGRPLLLGLDEPGEELGHLLALIRLELEHPRCGAGALLARAGEILLIAMLRHVIARPGTSAGVLAALADERIARAVVAIHEQPQARWSLERLAELAGMSRTAFAVGFRALMERPPGAYLAELRLAQAEREVAAGRGLKLAARASGYASAAALSRALARRRRALGSEADAGPAFRPRPSADRAPPPRAASVTGP